jgi:hypothetical protein
MSTKPWLAAMLAGAIATPGSAAPQDHLLRLQRATAWLGSSPLQETDLRGKFVVVSF